MDRRHPAKLDRGEIHAWIYYLTAGFLFGATVLRTVLLLDTIPGARVLTLLLLGLVLFVTEPSVSRRWSAWFTIYLVLQSALIGLLLVQSDAADFFAILFTVLAMQSMQRYPLRRALVALGAFALVMAVALLAVYEIGEAVALLAVYSAASGLVASYALATRRAAEASAHNRAMVVELEGANQRMRAYSTQLQRLAAARERHRLAHELHDSVTQTVFSMTLATQSAVLLLDQDRPRVATQLDRLAQLTRGALSEMQLLISELRPDKAPDGGLVAGLERHIAERASPQGLSVAVLAEGNGGLSVKEEQNLLRIGQEAINNIIKHARADSASIRLHLSGPFSMEIADGGQGFELSRASEGGGFGLDSMRERATEIGWDLEVVSSPGVGTRVVVEKRRVEG